MITPSAATPEVGGDARERRGRELIDRKGRVLGTIWGVRLGEPCWKELDMFFLSFCFEPTPAFKTYRPIFDALTQALQVEADRFRAWIENPKLGSRLENRESAPFREQIFEAIRIKEPNGEVWIPVVLRIDGGCGVLRATHIPCEWNGSEWVSRNRPNQPNSKRGRKPRWRFWSS